MLFMCLLYRGLCLVIEHLGLQCSISHRLLLMEVLNEYQVTSTSFVSCISHLFLNSWKKILRPKRELGWKDLNNNQVIDII